MNDIERAEWLAGMIPAYGDYEKEAAIVLRRLAAALDEVRRENERLRALVGEMREDIMSWLKHSENLDVDIYEVPSTVFRTPEEELHSNELIHRADAAIAEQRELTGEKG